LNEEFITGGNLQEGAFSISADSKFVVYRADQDALGQVELYKASLVNGGASKLNNDLPFSAHMYDFQISSNSRHVVYRSDQKIYREIELFVRRFEEQETCFPVKARNGKVAIICF
jgi:hypothetical protein